MANDNNNNNNIDKTEIMMWAMRMTESSCWWPVTSRTVSIQNGNAKVMNLSAGHRSETRFNLDLINLITEKEREMNEMVINHVQVAGEDNDTQRPVTNRLKWT